MPGERVREAVLLYTSADRVAWEQNKCNITVRIYMWRLFVILKLWFGISLHSQLNITKWTKIHSALEYCFCFFLLFPFRQGCYCYLEKLANYFLQIVFVLICS